MTSVAKWGRRASIAWSCLLPNCIGRVFVFVIGLAVAVIGCLSHLQTREIYRTKFDEYSVNLVFIMHDLSVIGLLIDIQAFNYWTKALNTNYVSKTPIHNVLYIVLPYVL